MKVDSHLIVRVAQAAALTITKTVSFIDRQLVASTWGHEKRQPTYEHRCRRTVDLSHTKRLKVTLSRLRSRPIQAKSDFSLRQESEKKANRAHLKIEWTNDSQNWMKSKFSHYLFGTWPPFHSLLSFLFCSRFSLDAVLINIIKLVHSYTLKGQWKEKHTRPQFAHYSGTRCGRLSFVVFAWIVNENKFFAQIKMLHTRKRNF